MNPHRAFLLALLKQRAVWMPSDLDEQIYGRSRTPSEAQWGTQSPFDWEMGALVDEGYVIADRSSDGQWTYRLAEEPVLP